MSARMVRLMQLKEVHFETLKKVKSTTNFCRVPVFFSFPPHISSTEAQDDMFGFPKGKRNGKQQMKLFVLLVFFLLGTPWPGTEVSRALRARNTKRVRKSVPEVRGAPESPKSAPRSPKRVQSCFFGLFSDFGAHFLGTLVRERPPGLLQHVLAVLVFWSWLLLLPWLPPWSRSLKLFRWASILLYGPLDILLGSAARSSPTAHAKTGPTTHVFQHRGAHADLGLPGPPP